MANTAPGKKSRKRDTAARKTASRGKDIRLPDSSIPGNSTHLMNLLSRVEKLEALLPLSSTVEASGLAWVTRFPGSKSTADCVAGFRASLDAFLSALSTAGAMVRIAATFRPPQRAYLMHWAWMIAHNQVAPQDVPPMTGVPIDWLHKDAAGLADIPKSRSSASQMVTAYGLVALPALVSRHTQGRAVDMTITWNGSLAIRNVNGAATTITSIPRNGMNEMLKVCGASYGVVKAKFDNDPPHWSDDGH